MEQILHDMFLRWRLFYGASMQDRLAWRGSGLDGQEIRCADTVMRTVAGVALSWC
jgi:hypothetical protein